MPTKHAILIGIDRTSGMDPLAAAAQSAIKMDIWAKSQGFETRLFVDSARKQVKAGDIVDTLEEILQSRPQQIVIYFSGHGCSRTAGSEIWFLPKALTRGEEAFDLVESKAKAYQSGVESIVFISDACRTAPNDHRVAMVTGRSLFPYMAKRNPATKIDMLYAAWPGDPAHESKGEAGDYSAIYTECLLTCLNGGVKEVITPVQKLKPNILGVMPHELNEYLMKAIPALIVNKGLFFQQQPMGEVNSRDPVYLSKIDEVKGPKPDDYHKGILDKMLPVKKTETIYGKKSRELLAVKLNKFIELTDNRIPPLGNSYLIPPREDGNWSFYEKLNIENNSSGFAINGEGSFSFYQLFAPGSIKFSNSELNPQKNIRIKRNTSSIEIPFKVANTVIAVSERNKTGFPIAIIPGFFCIITYKEERIVSVDYFPTSRNKINTARYEFAQVAERKAMVIAAARNGIFQASEEAGNYLRRFKSLDPTLGLFAAYAYAQGGNFEDIESVYEYIKRDDQAVIFDVELLRNLTKRDFKMPFAISEMIPLLTQGWSYLPMIYPPKQLLEVGKMLEPGLWTTFTTEGLSYLIEKFKFKSF